MRNSLCGDGISPAPLLGLFRRRRERDRWGIPGHLCVCRTRRRVRAGFEWVWTGFVFPRWVRFRESRWRRGIPGRFGTASRSHGIPRRSRGLCGRAERVEIVTAHPW